MMQKIVLVFFFYCATFLGFAQDSRQVKRLYFTSDTIQLDTLSIVPASVQVVNKEGVFLGPSFYKVDYSRSLLIIDKATLIKSGILSGDWSISYKTFPYLFSKEISHKNSQLVKPDLFGNKDLFNYTPQRSNGDIFNMGGLDKSGSISRGISFGNTQDMVVNSNLDLQLSGHLGNGVDILLAATDSNIPIQAEGNTQQLQEFDKVFVQLSKDSSKIIAGDYQLTRPDAYFLNFRKKAQGLQLSTVQKVNFDKAESNGINATSLSAAVSRGKFSRNIIQGVEGNQGPYRLVGAENETFLVVLSGTEKVYLNGRLLSRGQENDYIIDYNTAEITFTAKQLITKDRRIVVEFQYSDKNYARSLLHFGNDYEKGKAKVHVHVYSEQDNKNQPLQQTLSDDQKQLLSDIGDTLSLAVVPSFDSVTFSNNEVLYKQIDTTLNGIVYSVLEYSTNSDSAHYRASFKNVGQGNGNYISVESSINGKVFEWIAPDIVTGVLLGSYEPVIQLVTPKQKQMLSVGVDYEITKKTTLFVEGALSNNDINRYSSNDSDDDVGYSTVVKLENTQSRHSDTTGNGLQFISNLKYEYLNHNFSFIERFRPVEFERNWNRTSPLVLNDQHIVGVGVKLNKNQVGTLGYDFASFIEDTAYTGYKHGITSNIKQGGFDAKYNASLLNSESITNSTFYRHKSLLSQKVKFIRIGFKDEVERNEFTLDQSDSLLGTSQQFWEWKTFVENADTTNNKYGIDYTNRTDYAIQNVPGSSNFKKATLGEDYGGYLQLLGNPKSKLKFKVIYRTLKILDTAITLQKPDNTLLSRIEYDFRIWKGAVRSNSFYEIGSGLEVKKEFSYLEVAAGQGVYTWNDYNENGVKELNEFEVAAFSSDATYIKVYTPTLDYIKVFNNQFSEQLMIRPAAVWTNKKGVRKLIARLANQTVYRVDRKSTEKGYSKAFNPFLTNSTDNISLNSSFRNTLFINQLNPIIGVDLSYQNNRNVVLLVNGIDTRKNTFFETRLRWNMTKSLGWNITYKDGDKVFDSEYFDSRNFAIKYFELSPKLSYQPNTSFRISLLYKYSDKKNTLGEERAVLNDYGTEVKYNILQKGSFNANLNWVQVRYNDTENSSLSFEMLESLQVGNNVLWGASYQRNLSNNMQVSINYEGRQAEGSNAIHTGGAQVRAYF